ncbi:DUF1642 domain-containing protein [Streptococcus sp. H31]|uniref:DUF1642 domain-containing protein n=1 Tax=Streptococcus huangxiaojuni TaxID=3237239 RepID=UPI0034A2983F
MRKEDLIRSLKRLSAERMVIDSLINYIEKMDNQNIGKVIIPEFVASWIQSAKRNGLDLYEAMVSCVFDDKVDDWIFDNSEKFAKAWLYGYAFKEYAFKKELVYVVVIPVGDGRYKTVCMGSDGNLYLSDRNYRSKDKIKQHNSRIPGGLTEELIKNSELSWVWQFAEEVEDEKR